MTSTQIQPGDKVTVQHETGFAETATVVAVTKAGFGQRVASLAMADGTTYRAPLFRVTKVS